MPVRGRFALARWNEPDKSATHTFLDIENKTRKDIASGDLTLGQALIDDDGRVYSGKKPIFSFSTPPETPPAQAGPDAKP